MEEKKHKITIMEALEILQGIRYYDSRGNIFYLTVDESVELRYLEREHQKYDIPYKRFIRVLKIADELEHFGLINISNEERLHNYPPNYGIHPLIRIKRKTYYK